MSESQQTPPEPSESSPNGTNLPAEAPSSEPEQREPSGIRAFAIQVLKGLIQVLEGVVARLEEPPTGDRPSEQRSWLWIGGAVAVVLLFVVLQSRQPASKPSSSVAVAPSERVEVPTKSEPSPATPSKTPSVSQPAPSDDTAIAPEPASEPPSETSSEFLPEAATEQTAMEPEPLDTETTQEATQPGAIGTVPEEDLAPPLQPQPVLAPAPLSPEQTLIAMVREDLEVAAQKLADGFVQSVAADFRSNLLTVTITDDWYSLDPKRQTRLAQNMFERSRSLDFSRLNVVDPAGHLVARNAVIGDKMIVLRGAGDAVNSSE